MNRSIAIAIFASTVYAAPVAAAGDTKLAKETTIAEACRVFLSNHLTLPPDCPRYLSRLKERAHVQNARASLALSPPPPAAETTKHQDRAGDRFLLIRQDQYDQISYIWPAYGYEILQGASVSYTSDQLSKTQALNLKGFFGYSVFNATNDRQPRGCGRDGDGGGTFLAGYGFGPFIQTTGTLNEPKTASERSALRAGGDIDFHWCDAPLFEQQNLQLLPYYQTDFRGQARMTGLDTIWEPFAEQAHIGGRLDVLSPKLVGYYFRILGEANVLRVNDNGLTNFLPHTNYAFLGGTAEVRAVLFENYAAAGPWLCGTTSFIGTARYLWDAAGHKPIYLLGAELDYRIGGKSASTANCGTASNTLPNGTTSVALSYNRGTDPLTLVKQDKYMASLKFSY